jgi:WD40 repeat protein
MKIFIWNVGKSTILTTIECHPEVILSVSWNYNGSRIVTSCKDKILRVINPRTGQVIKVKLIRIKKKDLSLLCLVCSQEMVIKVLNLQELFIYVMVVSFRRDFRECQKDNMPFGMGFVNI